MLRRLLKSKKGQALAEYAVILVAVMVVSLAAITVLGHNVGDLLATTAAILPGSEPDYDAPVYVGEFIELTVPGAGAGPITLNITEIATAINDATPTYRLDVNITDNQHTTAWLDLVEELH